MRISLRLSLWLWSFIPIIAAAQAPGSVDPTFNPTDQGHYLGHGANGQVRDVVRQPDGKLVIAGQFTAYNGVSAISVARIDANGLLDTTFSAGNGGGWLECIALQADGKLLVGGTFTVFNGESWNNLVRLDTDGSIDTTFAATAGANSDVNSIAVQDDGRIVLGGAFDAVNGLPRSGIARLMQDGSLDLSFDPGTGMESATHTVEELIVQPDGKIFCAGAFLSYNGTPSQDVVRLQNNGAIDLTFTSMGFNGWPTCVVRQNNGSYILGGLFNGYDGQPGNNIVRITSSGAYDNTFATGAGFDNRVDHLIMQTDGKVIVSGFFHRSDTTARECITRLLQNGHDDASFINEGAVNTPAYLSPYVIAVLVEPSNKLIVAGNFFGCSGRTAGNITRLNSGGTIDPLFNPGYGVSRSVSAIAVQPDLRIVVGGDVGYNGILRYQVFRTLPDGALDNSFTSPFTLLAGSNYVDLLRLQPDGRILAAGLLEIHDSITVRLVRLMPDGALDTAFTPCAGYPTNIKDIELQPDGRIIVAGDFTTYNGTACEHIVRLMPDGAIDTTFAFASAFDDVVSDVALQVDGKVIAVGWFNTHAGNTVPNVVRLNGDGTLDGNYQVDGASIAYRVGLQSSGKAIILGGWYNGIVRLDTNGTADTTFAVAGPVYGSVHRSFVQTDDRVLLFAQDNTPICGAGTNSLVRLLPDGACDVDFATGSTPFYVRAMAEQAGQKLIVGGAFGQVQGIGRNGLARLFGEDIGMTTATPELAAAIKIHPNPTNGSLTVDLGDHDLDAVRLFDLLGKDTGLSIPITSGPLQVDLGPLPDGLYLLQLRTGASVITQRIIKHGE